MFRNMNDRERSVHPSDDRPPVPPGPTASPKLVFVTGATGLLGNNLVRQLVAAGHRVRALVRSEEKARRLLGDLPEGVLEIVRGDMQDVAAFADRVRGCDAVIHTAAYFREYYQSGSHGDALERINVQATLELIAVADAAGVERFIHTGSSGAVGKNADGTPGNEETPAGEDQLRNGYFRSKVQGDERIRAWTPVRGTRVIEILPGWMWGPGDAGPTAAGQFVADFMARKIPIVPDGGTSTVDARDVAVAMVTCLERGQHGDRFIVAGRFRTLAQILSDLAAVTGIPGPKMHLPHPLVMSFAFLEELRARCLGGTQLVSREGVRVMRMRIEVSSARAERDLGVTFRPFEETVRDVVAWQSRATRRRDRDPSLSGLRER